MLPEPLMGLYLFIGRVFPHWFDSILEQVIGSIHFHMRWRHKMVETRPERFDLYG